MSFILEALAKSEQARQQALATPGFSLIADPANEVPQRRLLPQFLFAALMVNAALLMFWTSSSWFERPASIKSVEPLRTPSPLLSRRETAPPESKAVDSDAVQPIVTSPAEVPQVPLVSNVAREIPIVTVKSPGVVAGTVPAVQEKAPSSKPAAQAVERAWSTGQGLPPIAIAGFIRDDSEGGMVIVNDKLVHEGDEISPGLKLEKILPDGLLFNFKGERFKR
jgi:general secretion pathway protein B